MRLKPSIAVGIDKDGKFSCLYVGADAAAALAAIDPLPSGIVRAEAYRKLAAWKKRSAPDVPQEAETPTPEPEQSDADTPEPKWYGKRHKTK